MTGEMGIPIKQIEGIPDAGPRIGDPRLIILHHTGVSAQEAIDLFRRSGGKSSSHYLVTKKGEILQLIPDDRLANHLSAKQPEKKISLGIEIENSGRVSGRVDDHYPEAQYKAISLLVARLERKHGIPHDGAHIKGHYEVDYNRAKDRKWDPSPNFEWTKINLPNHPTLKTIMGSEIACKQYYDLWEKGCVNNCAKYNMRKGDYATGQTCERIFSK